MSGHQVIRSNEEVTLQPGGLHAITVSCPPGHVVVGGGQGHNAFTNLTYNIDAEISMPSPNTSTFNTSTTQWTVAWINRDDAARSISLAAYAICIAAP